MKKQDFDHDINEINLREILHDREILKLTKLMSIRQEISGEKIIRNLIKVIPASVKFSHIIPPDVIEEITSIDREEKWIRILYKNRFILRTFPSRQQYRNYYYCFWDKMPPIITPESYQPAYDLSRRFLAGDKIIQSLKSRGFVEKKNDLNIIECGAYNGWKALGFAQHIGKSGKIIALEIDEDQFELCQLNLQENLEKGRFHALHSGVWNKVEEKEYTFEHYASHSLSTPDEHLHHSQVKKIRTDTLDNIIEKSGIETFDFLNIQTGGSEFESLEGLVNNLNRVKVMWVGTHYVHEGVSIRYKVIKRMLELGCRVYYASLNRVGTGHVHEVTDDASVNRSDTGGVWVVSPAWKDRIVPR